MKIIVTPKIVEMIKADLRQALPGVGSSHRVEAAARGLSWSTNAAMRFALVQSPVERELNVDAFATYLSKRGFVTDGHPLIQSARRIQIRAVMEAHRQLSHFGFGVYNEHRLSNDAWRAEMAKNREAMLSDNALREFELACEYLSLLKTIKTPNRKHASYGLKHAAERYHRRNGFADRKDDAYVSNGMLLAAAYHLGLQVVRTAWDSSNAFLNISSRSFRELEADQTPLPQPEPGQYFRVLGHNQGIVFYLPAGARRVFTLRPTAHTPAKLVQLAPLDYWTSHFPPKSRRSPFNTYAAFVSLLDQAWKAGIYQPPTR